MCSTVAIHTRDVCVCVCVVVGTWTTVSYITHSSPAFPLYQNLDSAPLCRQDQVGTLDLAIVLVGYSMHSDYRCRCRYRCRLSTTCFPPGEGQKEAQHDCDSGNLHSLGMELPTHLHVGVPRTNVQVGVSIRFVSPLVFLFLNRFEF